MKQKIIQGQHSNYEVEIVAHESDMKQFKDKALQHFQNDIQMPGFRKGHVPLDMVEKQVQPEYLTMGIYEEVINHGIKKLLDENKEIRFIGNPYDIKDVKKDDEVTFTFKLDVYPEVVVKNADWKKLSINAIDTQVTEQEIQQTIENLQRQYAEYKDADEITESTVSKIKFEIFDKEGNQIDKGSSFIGKEEFAEHAIVKKHFIGQKKNEKTEMKYDHDKLPHIFHFHKKEGVPAKITFEAVDIKSVLLPEINEATIAKLFGAADPTIKTKEDLITRVTEVMKEQKQQNSLMKSIDEVLKQAMNSLSVLLPKTIVDEELKGRMKSFQERAWGEAAFKQYLQQIWEQKSQELVEELTKSAKESLEKFFVFQKLTELFELTDVDWNKQMDAELKLYEKLIGGEDNVSKETPVKKTAAKKKTA